MSLQGAAVTPERGIYDYAKKRFLLDAEFHAKVETAVLVLQRLSDLLLTDDERALATMAAAVGLAMEWVDPQTGQILDR